MHSVTVLRVLLLWIALLGASAAHAQRIKDLVMVQGVRVNQLAGYGLVVGLDGSGDQTTQTPFTVQSIINMLTNLGVNLPAGTNLQLKNVAAVMVTAELPAFAKPGQKIDVTVSSMGNAKSLRGGTLLMAPLKGADGQIYAMAQGNLVVGGAGAAAGGSSVQVNHLSAGRVTGGATVERSVPTALGEGNVIRLGLNRTDFTTASRIVAAINEAVGSHIANAVDGRVIEVVAPIDANDRIAFLSRIESLNVTPGTEAAKVIFNARTGSVVMNQAVTVDTCAVAHGSLAVSISVTPVISQPSPLSGGETVVEQVADIEIKEQKGQLVMFEPGVLLSDVVKALNAVGATPQDLLAILQAMQVAGALNAELEVI
ncbi:MAG: flagellar basal body P-ring protein FlgI [Burkholderiales bacterium]